MSAASDRSLLLAMVTAAALGLIVFIATSEDSIFSRLRREEENVSVGEGGGDIFVRPWSDLNNATWVIGISEDNIRRQNRKSEYLTFWRGRGGERASHFVAFN